MMRMKGNLRVSMSRGQAFRLTLGTVPLAGYNRFIRIRHPSGWILEPKKQKPLDFNVRSHNEPQIDHRLDIYQGTEVICGVQLDEVVGFWIDRSECSVPYSRST